MYERLYPGALYMSGHAKSPRNAHPCKCEGSGCLKNAPHHRHMIVDAMVTDTESNQLTPLQANEAVYPDCSAAPSQGNTHGKPVLSMSMCTQQLTKGLISIFYSPLNLK